MAPMADVAIISGSASDAAITDKVRKILDANNKPIPGFRFADCAPITTDALSAVVQWKRPLAELQGTPLKLEIALENASLFAIEVTISP